jgi:NAD(P)-dependent dehydrogenase (short-subunit alcohol dehydrogenase family)
VLTIRQSTSETVALISGGNRGLGRETARQLAAKGMKVVIGSRDSEAGQVTARELSVHGVVAAVELDVTDEASVRAAIEFVAARFDGLDVLVNNAGRIVEEAAVSTTAEQLQDVFATNVFGAATMIRLALPMLARSAAPRIINVSSTTGSVSLTAAGADFGGNADLRLSYAASKAALNMLTLQYARAFQADPALSKIRINSATPGYTATDLNRGEGVKSVAEGAAIIVSLALLELGDVTGGFYNDEGPVAW